MITLIAIFVGSSIGTLLRYLVITFWPWRATYITAVFTVNMLGTFFMGILYSTNQIHLWHNVLSVGVLGGLTTFSTMMTQSAQHSRSQQMVYLSLQIVAGLLSFCVGVVIGLIL